MTRRQLIQLSLMAGLAPAAAAPLQRGSGRKTGSDKKGICITKRGKDWQRVVKDLRARWFYTWGKRIPENKPEGVDFIPMIWKYEGDRTAVIEAGRAAKEAGIKELLGFNEPDQDKQANMTVERALDAWPILQETGLRLGSPACVHPDREWMTAFMKEAKKRDLKVDFICVHSYGGTDVKGFIRRLQEVHKLYRKPVWITEFAVGDWEASDVSQNRHKPDDVLRFMEDALPQLDRLDFIERYAWFSAQPDNRALGTSALLDAEGKLTRLGECYRDA